MLRMSYRFMARQAAKKNLVKATKAKGLVTPKFIAPPVASILNAPVAPPLRMETPSMPSLDLTEARQQAGDAATTKPVTRKPLKKTASKGGKKKASKTAGKGSAAGKKMAAKGNTGKAAKSSNKASKIKKLSKKINAKNVPSKVNKNKVVKKAKVANRF